MLPDEEKPSEKVLAGLEQDSITQVIQDANQISETEELMAEFEKQQKIEAERKRLEDEYYKARENNPWDYQFMPEGWSIFGQTYITPIDDI